MQPYACMCRYVDQLDGSYPYVHMRMHASILIYSPDSACTQGFLFVVETAGLACVGLAAPCQPSPPRRRSSH
eukprot:3803301-Pyramimonas_sp.AAC.1